MAVDDRGVLHGDIPGGYLRLISRKPARVGLSVHLAETPENVSWLGLGPHGKLPGQNAGGAAGALDITPGGDAHAVYLPDGKMVCAVIRGSWRWERIS